MKISAGADGNNLESPIAKRFGHAEYYINYDTENKTFESFINNEEEHDHKILEDFLIKGVEAFIVGNIGPHAFDIINTPKSKVYLARKMSVKEAIDKLIRGELEQLDVPTAKKSIGHKHDEKHHHKDGHHANKEHYKHNH